ncbi:hypothetical protein [Streptomyces sp. NPDC051992]|uniref:hypothetical protein n=1 Tax=Streptomyces sp. NPDC051992 TaxID=3161012 RepID=UPI00344408B2
MSEQKIGAQLDALGLTADIEDGYRITEATVHLTAEGEGGSTWHSVARVSRQAPESLPVPSPVEVRVVTVVREGQEVTGEQRARVNRWLEANGIDPKRVALRDITVESKVRGGREGRHLIGFTEFYQDETGYKVLDEKKRIPEAVTYQRWVRQTVPLEPDPTWVGWPEARRQEKQAQQEREA